MCCPRKNSSWLSGGLFFPVSPSHTCWSVLPAPLPKIECPAVIPPILRDSTQTPPALKVLTSAPPPPESPPSSGAPNTLHPLCLLRTAQSLTQPFPWATHHLPGRIRCLIHGFPPEPTILASLPRSLHKHLPIEGTTRTGLRAPGGRLPWDPPGAPDRPPTQERLQPTKVRRGLRRPQVLAWEATAALSCRQDHRLAQGGSPTPALWPRPLGLDCPSPSGHVKASAVEGCSFLRK